MIPLRLVVILPLFLAGCLVTRTVYEAEVSRVRSLEYEMASKDVAAAELREEIAELQQSQERLELELRSLDVERVELSGNLEDLRLANERMREGLEDEREKLREREGEIREISSTYRSLVEELEAELSRGEIRIQELRGQLKVSALDEILFDSGQAEIKSEGQRVLAAVAEQVGQLSGYSIRVEGHTDDRPISTPQFPSNWELSTARAVVVLRLLERSGLDPAILSAVGYGPHQPVVANDSAENRSRNRRIEIVLIPNEPG
jgi:chemotaxis protein MotB